MIRRRIVLLYWIIALTLFVPSAAHAYIDPATTTYLIQIATALVVTVGVSLSVLLYRFRTVSSKIKFGFWKLFYRMRSKGQANTQEDIPTKKTEAKAPYAFPDFALPGSPEPPELPSFDEPVRETLAKKADTASQDKIDPSATPLTYTGRLRTAVPVTLALCFSFIIIGCLELTVQYAPEMPFELSSVVPVVLICFAAVFVLLLLIVPLFKGKVFDVFLLIGLSILIAGYVQGNFLNRGIGKLTGDAVIWSDLKPQFAASIICWILCFALIFLLWQRTKNAWRKALLFAPLLLILLQSVSFVTVLNDHGNDGAPGDGVFWKAANETLTVEGIYELAYEKNAIIFVLDRLDQEFIEEIAEEDPYFFDPLDGFTEFDDYISYNGSTFPAVAGFLTGHQYMYDEPRTEYFNRAWSDAAFLETLKGHDIDIRLYMDRGFAYSHIRQLDGIANNIFEGEIGINKRIALVKLVKLSAYRYAPMPLKRFFLIAPTEFIDTLELTDKTFPYIVDDFSYYSRMMENGLSVCDEQNSFIYYHLLGPHPPLNMDENIQYVEESTLNDQAKGAFKIVYEYLDRMKTLGLYDDALIIIMGDHGNYLGDELTRPARTALFIKSAGSSGTPLEISHAPVSPDQLHATLMEGFFGHDYGFGDSFFDIEEGAPVTREYAINHWRYEINGDGRDFSNWRFIGQFPEQYG